MPLPAKPILFAALVVPTLAAPAQQRPAARGTPVGSVTSVTIQQRMIIRVPRLSARPGDAVTLTRAQSPIRWTEKKAGKCVALIEIAAASIGERDSVDLILNGGKRLRAKLGDSCRALDFYSGFYVRMTPDQKLCASRDAFRARSGEECRIKTFRTLVAKR